MQAVYAFVLVLGLREVFLASHSFIINLPDLIPSELTTDHVIVIVLILNNILLGVRFFWVPRNLRKFIVELALPPEDGKGRSDVLPLPNWCFAINWLIIILHSILFFLLCAEFEFVVFSISTSSEINHSIFSGYVYLHVSLLIINGLWISMLTSQEQRLLALRAKQKNTRETAFGSIWSYNNLIFGLFALAPFLVASGCGPDMLHCLTNFQEKGSSVNDILPISILGISAFYDFVQALVGSTKHFAIFWVLTLLILNSLIDLLFTAKYYVIFEEIEWDKN